MENTQKKRQLVRDLMSVGVPSCGLETPIRQIGQMILEENLEAVIVLDDYGHAAGVVGQDELVKAYILENEHLTAEDIMDPEVPKILADIPLAAAAQIMQDQKKRIMYITHHAGGIEYPAAMISYRHLLRHLTVSDEDELTDLGIKAARQAPLEQFYKRREEARRRNKPT